MVTREGRVKVLDFGLAKMMDTNASVAQGANLTITADGPVSGEGHVVGTVPYMAPEQLRGEAVDARADLFSLGVILYELATGRRPFTGETSIDVGHAILRDAPEPLSRVRTDVPSDLGRIVSTCLEKSLRERAQTALEVNNALRRLRSTVEHGEPEKPASDKVTSIAVLPFVNRSASAEDEYFSDGLADELLSVLSKIPGLRVISRSSAFSFKGKQATAVEIGRALDVAILLEGSVRKAGHRVRISVQLVRVTDSSQLWSETYDRMLDDIFAVQDDIAQSVMKELRTTVLGEEKTAVLKHHTENPEAYQRYLRGRYHWYQMRPEHIAKSREYFEQAIALDNDYALAYCGLADYYGFASAIGAMPPDQGWPEAESAARKALELDDRLGEAYNPLAALLWMYYRDWPGAERSIKRGIELSPQFAELHLLYAFYLAAQGRFDESILEGRRGLRSDPLSLRHCRYLGNWYYYARRYEEAVSQYGNALELDPDNALVYEDLGNAFEQAGLSGKAVESWRRAMALAGDGELSAIQDDAYAKGGFSAATRAVAAKRLERLHARRAGGGYVSAIDFARSHVRLGNQDEAFEWMERACDDRTAAALFLKSDPFYDRIRSDPRFRDLLRRVGLHS